MILQSTFRIPIRKIRYVENGESIHTLRTKNDTYCLNWHPSKTLLSYTNDKYVNILGFDSK